MKLSMSKLVTLPLDFQGKEYCMLVKINYVSLSIEFVVTIMNGKLESMLYGSHCFRWQDGLMTSHTRSDEHIFANDLKLQITKSLEEYIHSHPTNESIF